MLQQKKNCTACISTDYKVLSWFWSYLGSETWSFTSLVHITVTVSRFLIICVRSWSLVLYQQRKIRNLDQVFTCRCHSPPLCHIPGALSPLRFHFPSIHQMPSDVLHLFPITCLPFSFSLCQFIQVTYILVDIFLLYIILHHTTPFYISYSILFCYILPDYTYAIYYVMLLSLRLWASSQRKLGRRRPLVPA